MKLLIALLLYFSSLFPHLTYAAESNIEKRDHVLVSLVSDHDTISSQQKFKVGLKFLIDDHWHIYWKNPGDSGTAPRMHWQNTGNIKVSDFHWPTPKIFRIPPLANYGYDKEIVFPMDVEVINADGKIEIVGTAEWLVCKVECVPGKATLRLSLPLGQEKIAKESQIIEKYLSLDPITHHDIKLSFEQDATHFKVHFTSSDLDLTKFESAYFYCEDGTYVAHADPQPLSKDKNGITLTLKKSEYLTQDPKELKGLLTLEKKGEPRLSFEVRSNLSSDSKVGSSNADGNSVSLAMSLLFAFLGGLILNLMPCVFPVISIKILGFVDSSQKTNTEISSHGWAYTLGVLVSFLVLSGVLILLRSLGQSLGWGFQLQSPYFVIFMSVLFFMIALNLFGLFEVGENLVGVGSQISRQKDFVGSFFTGILATLVATPCTAPFMGSALGFAVTLPPVQSIMIFLMLGFGMAFPYLILCYFPSWIKKLPKPGPWMKIFKEILAFPMLLTVLWLLWVLSLQTSSETVLYVLLFLTSMIFAVWSFKSIKNKIVKWILILVVLISSGFYLYKNLQSVKSESHVKSSDVWKPYSESELQKYLDEGSSVFVDFTAAWCITCQVNKKVVLNTDKIQLAFKNANVVLMKADWTNQDPEITKALSQFHRNSVPLYVLYSVKNKMEPMILPEILTDDIVLTSLKKL